MIAHYFNSSKSYLFAGLGTLFLAIGIFISIQFWSKFNTEKKINYLNNVTLTNQVAEHLASFIAQTKTIVEQTIQHINEKNVSMEAVQELLTIKPKSILGLGVSYASPQNPTLYYVEHEDKQEFNIIDNLFKSSTWAQQAYAGRAGFYGPVKDLITGENVIIYAAPFYRNTVTKPVGIIFATQSLAHLNHIISTLYTGTQRHWFIAQADGKILLHPVKQYATIDQIIKTLKNNEYKNEITGRRAWLINAPIASLGWQLYGAFDQQDNHVTSTQIRRHYFFIILCFLLSFLFLSFLLLCRSNVGMYHIWLASSIVTIIFFGAIIACWFYATRYSDHPVLYEKMSNKVTIYKFLDVIATKENIEHDTDYYLNYRYSKGAYVPTGIYVNSLEFSSPDQIEFVGYIWQRYFEKTHDDISRGFIFPHLADTPTIQEISHTKDGRTETIMWLVRARLNQNVEYKKYPFDTKDIQIQIWHKDFSKNIILVPDLDAYQILSPSMLPGIGNDVALIGWRLTDSGFGYMNTHYTTNFGLYAYGPFGTYKSTDKSGLPELLFNVTAQRTLIDTIIIRIIPLLVIAILLFIIILTDISQGFAGLVASAAAIFFGLIIAHMQFREKLPGTQVVYLETFFLIMYITIMLVLLSSLLDLFKAKISFVRYKNNVITKALYWPAILCMILVSTLIYLY